MPRPTTTTIPPEAAAEGHVGTTLPPDTSAAKFDGVPTEELSARSKDLGRQIAALRAEQSAVDAAYTERKAAEGIRIKQAKFLASLSPAERALAGFKEKDEGTTTSEPPTTSEGNDQGAGQQ